MPGFSVLTHSFSDSQVPEVTPGDAGRKGGARRTARTGCGPAPAGKVSRRGQGRGQGARAVGRGSAGEGAAACAGSEWLAAGGGRERPGTSRSACGPPGPQPRLLCLRRTRPHSDPPRLGSAAAPPDARSRPAAAAAAARSVGQSVTERAARELRALTARLGKERRAWGRGGGGGGWKSASGCCPARGRYSSRGRRRTERLER